MRIITRAAAMPAALALAAFAAAQPTPPPQVEAAFSTYAPGAAAVTYDTTLVPAGATVRLALADTDTTPKVTLWLTGLNPDHTYGAHLHQRPCGPDGAAAGPHYQHTADPAATPEKPSADPAYANATNEVWLDFTTGPDGSAQSSATHQWPFNEQNPPRSLILHAEATQTAAGHAGMAGARLACVNLP
ncbi:superoxide dismutase family protein [Catellatospora vulcania]|uniref:superoxide dismutase family protein n=1 Tax=Catellatospora vulcania TaxID=1460450 RepID=UPI0012D3D381|nr:superoxide dismutase family protein [Catellatospora vulcania]